MNLAKDPSSRQSRDAELFLLGMVVFVTRSVFLLLCAVPAFGQLPEHSKVLDAEFANLFSGSESVPGVVLRPETKGTAIRGIVRTSNGAIAKNADVWAFGFWGNRIPCRERTRTDDEGRFTIRIPNDARLGKMSWGINIFHRTESASATGLGPGKKSGGVVRLKAERRSLSLSVRDKQNKPVSAFRVYLEDGRVLDHAGAEPMQVHGLRSGVISMCVLATGFAREVLHFDTTTVNPTLLEVQLSEGRTISGTIRDTNGNPLANSGVNRFFGNAVTAAGRKVLGDKNGRYRYAGARKSAQRFFAFLCVPKGSREYLQVPYGTGDIDNADGVLPTTLPAPAVGGIAMLAGGGGPDQETGSVCGRVVDPNGKPVRNFRIRLEGPRKKPVEQNFGGFAAVYSSVGILGTDANGRFRVTGIDRNRVVRVLATVDGYRDAFVDLVKTVDTSAKPDFDAVTLKLQKPQRLEVAVRKDDNKIRWVLLATYPEREAYTAAYYIQAGARQLSAKRTNGKLAFESIEFNDGVLAAIRGRETAVVPWRGETRMSVDVKSLNWVKPD